MGLLYGRAGRLTDKNGGFRPRAEKLEGLGTAEDGLLRLLRRRRLPGRDLAGVVGRLLPAGPGSSLGPGPPGA